MSSHFVILWALRDLLRNEAAAMRRVRTWSHDNIREMMLAHYHASLVLIAETYRAHNHSNKEPPAHETIDPRRVRRPAVNRRCSLL
jgi:hypothetical protein